MRRLHRCGLPAAIGGGERKVATQRLAAQDPLGVAFGASRKKVNEAELATQHIEVQAPRTRAVAVDAAQEKCDEQIEIVVIDVAGRVGQE